MADKPLVFLSHSALHDPDAQDLLTALDDALRAAGFDVLLDRTRLEGGEDWRICVHTWMAHCDAAVVLMTPKALASNWVLKEATILSWRWALQARGDGSSAFPFIPILIDVTPGQLQQHPAFAPLDLGQVQVLTHRRAADTIMNVTRIFKPLLAQKEDTPRRRLEEQIASLLRPAGEAVLRRFIKDLGQDFGGWRPGGDAASEAAAALMQAPFDNRLPPILQQLAVLDATKLKTLIDTIACSWVQLDAAAQLTVVARSGQEVRAAILNAADAKLTSRAYIGRASAKMTGWPSVPLTDAGGEDIRGAIVAQVRAHLARIFGTDDPIAIRELLKQQDAYEPLLIVVPPSGTSLPLLDDDDLVEVAAQFRPCAVLVLTGSRMPDQGVLRAAHRLMPELTDVDEQAGIRVHRLCYAASRIPWQTN